MKNIYLLIALVVGTLLFSGCSYHREYPTNWKALPTTSQLECPDITGKYNNEGEGDNPKYKPSLTWYLFRDAVPWREAKYVSFKQEEIGKLNVSIWRDIGRTIYSKTFSKEANEFSCQQGQIKIETNKYTNRDGAVGGEWITLTLIKSDNYLIVKNENVGVGMMFFIPFAGSGTSWYRFREINE